VAALLDVQGRRIIEFDDSLTFNHPANVPHYDARFRMPMGHDRRQGGFWIAFAGEEDASTGGPVYVGCGREFRCDKEGNDFKQGTIDIFVFGANANVKNPDLNDPRNLNCEMFSENRGMPRLAPIFSGSLTVGRARTAGHWFCQMVFIGLQ